MRSYLGSPASLLVLAAVLLATHPTRGAAPRSIAAECGDRANHPEWIFCEDFEDRGPLVGAGRFFEVSDDEGDFVPQDGVGLGGSRAMRGLWQVGEIGAGSLKVAFGRNPNGYMRKGIRPDEDFREIYYRMYLRHQPGWRGDPAKLSRATVFTSSADWSQAMIAHLWGDGHDHLLIDPARCVGIDNRVRCVGYNDFDHLEWLGNQAGTTLVFSTAHADRWFCVEAHVRLNDPGRANGIQEFWIEDRLEARRDDLDFVRRYNAYALNAVFFENYWNDGSPREQARYFDNIVISTERIGCLDVPEAGSATPSPRPSATTTPPPTASATDSATPTRPPTATDRATPTDPPTATATASPNPSVAATATIGQTSSPTPVPSPTTAGTAVRRPLVLPYARRS